MKISNVLLAAATASLTALTTVVPVYACPASTPSHTAHGVMDAIVSQVDRLTDAQAGTLPTNAQGTAIGRASAAGSAAKVTTLYRTTADGSGYCVATHAAGMAPDRVWYFDSARQVASKTSPRKAMASGGACGEVLTRMFRAAGYETMTLSDAQQVAVAVETYAGDNLTFPSTADVVLEEVALSRGDSLVIYELVEATGKRPAGYRLCVVHERGAWTTYDSLRSGVVAHGKHGKTCSFRR